MKLAAERAQKAELEKAAAAAKAAEDARIAAEKQKQIEQAKAEAAERERKVAEAAAARALAEKQVMEKAAADAAAKQVADKQASNAESKKVAALSPPPSSAPGQDLPRSVQVELRRVGCMKAEPYSEWSETAQRSLTLFNKYAGTKFDAKVANADVLDALKGKSGRVCPLVCDHGFRADGDQCSKIVCRAGHRISDDNECEKIPEKKPVATRDEPARRDSDRKKSESSPAASQANSSGQIVCTNAGCRPLRPGCKLGRSPSVAINGGGLTEVCN
ncbi:hypothetical protein ABH982_004093 [Bradyrhizobium ottawaense]